MIYLIISFFGTYLIFRVVFPIIWCIDFLFNNINDKYYGIVFFHLLYLIVQGILIILLIRYIIKLVKKHRRIRNNMYYIYIKNKEAVKYGKLAIMGILIFLIFNYNNLPIFMKRGSDSIMILAEQHKIKTWLWFGVLNVFIIILVFSIMYINNKKKKYYYWLIAFMASLISGKKSAIIRFVSQIILLYYLLSYRKPNLPWVKIFIGFFLGIVFIVYQYTRTIGVAFNLSQLKLIFDIVYSSSTVYLDQIIEGGGIKYIDLYSHLLGDYGPIIYILNPFIKFLFGVGIYKSIGPFLGEVLYGYTLPNGVNPTLFFEVLFVFGSTNIFFVFFSFVIMCVIIYLAKIFIKNVIIGYNKNMLFSIIYFYLFLLCFSFLNDTLNTIRNLPFAFVPFLVYILEKFLRQLLKNK